MVGEKREDEEENRLGKCPYTGIYNRISPTDLGGFKPLYRGDDRSSCFNMCGLICCSRQ